MTSTEADEFGRGAPDDGAGRRLAGATVVWRVASGVCPRLGAFTRWAARPVGRALKRCHARPPRRSDLSPRALPRWAARSSAVSVEAVPRSGAPYLQVWACSACRVRRPAFVAFGRALHG